MKNTINISTEVFWELIYVLKYEQAQNYNFNLIIPDKMLW